VTTVPPLLTGAVHDNETWLSLGVAVRPCGDDANEKAVAETTDAFPPMGVTRMPYEVPSVRPLSVIDVAVYEFVELAPVHAVQPAVKFALYSTM
jgi:hypothetical protein